MFFPHVVEIVVCVCVCVCVGVCVCVYTGDILTFPQSVWLACLSQAPPSGLQTHRGKAQNCDGGPEVVY